MRKYGVQLYSVRDEFRKDMWGTLRKVKAMGYDGVEFFWEFSHTAQEVKAALDDTGLACCGWHTPWHYVQPSNLMATITYNKVIGNKEIAIPGLPGEMTNNKEAWFKTAKQFNDVAEKLAFYGMNLSYHNHADEFKNMEGDLPIYYFMDGTIPSIGLQLDNGNAFSAGADTDVYAPVTRYPGRMRTLHHKPYSIQNGFATMIGEDDIDWPRFFALCDKHHNIDWHIVEYEDAKYTQLQGVELCLKALKKME
jgi:sugar phosphate isomerase/epimerase